MITGTSDIGMGLYQQRDGGPVNGENRCTISIYLVRTAVVLLWQAESHHKLVCHWRKEKAAVSSIAEMNRKLHLVFEPRSLRLLTLASMLHSHLNSTAFHGYNEKQRHSIHRKYSCLSRKNIEDGPQGLPSG